MLQDTATERLDNDQREAVNKIVAESNRMSLLISDLLKLSRVGSQELKLETVNLSITAQVVFQDLMISMNLKNKERFDFTVQPEMTAIADPGLMRVLFDNLIGNAIKFSSKTQNASILIGSFTQKDEIVFFVKDNGAGFKREKAERIFEPFTRFHSPKDFPGTGIGLSIVRKIIERHHGRIWVESEINKGTTFYFTISEG